MTALPPAQRVSTRSPQRQTGFRVPSPNNADAVMMEDDGFEKQAETQGRPQPLAIPRSSGPTSAAQSAAAETSTSHVSEISTPPDGVGLTGNPREMVSATSISGRWPDKVPVTATASSSSASSLEPSSWTLSGSRQPSRSFGANSAGHTISPIAGLSASNDGRHKLAPYLSTSFRTSAERRGGGVEEDEMEVDEGDDVFGWSARSGGAQHAQDSRFTSARLVRGDSHHSQSSTRRGASGAPEGDDAAGVFSFSSPYFDARSLEAESDAAGSQRSPPSPQLATSSRGDQRLMSPGWTATSLARMSLGGGASHGTPDRASLVSDAPYEASTGPARSARASAFSPRQVNSNAIPGGATSSSSSLTHGHGRKPSVGRRPPLSFTPGSGSGISHSLSHAHESSTPPSANAQTSARALSATYGRSRSRSRQRPSFSQSGERESSERGASAAPSNVVDDDDATDDEMFDLDDNNEGYGTASQATIRGRRQGDPSEGARGLPASWTQSGSYVQRGISPQRRPPVTTMSASFERAGAHMAAGAGSGGTALARGYSNDRHHHQGYPAGSFSLSRHHPYATSPGPSSFGTSHGHLGAHSAQLASPGLNGISRPGQIRGVSSSGAPYGSPANPSTGYGPGSYNASPHVASNAALPPLYNFAVGESLMGAQPLPAGQGALTSASSSRSGLSTSASSHDSGASTGMGTSPGTSAAIQRSAPRNVAIGAAGDGAEGDHLTQASPSARLSSSAGAPAAGETPEMAEVTAIRERLGGAANCSAFISKLWYLMCRPELYSTYLRWSEAGDSIILFSDQDIANEFASDVLPRLFKHGNNASFVRQLNLYGFQRVPSSRLLDSVEHKVAKRPGGLKGVSNISTALQYYGPHSSFSHPRFLRDREDLLTSMKPRSSKKPKKSNGSNASGGAVGADEDEE